MTRAGREGEALGHTHTPLASSPELGHREPTKHSHWVE